MHDNHALLQPFVAAFEDRLSAELHGCRVVTVPAGVPLASEGDEIVYTPVVLHGSVKVTRTAESGFEMLLYHIAPGESCVISIAAGLSGDTRPARALHAVAEVESVLLLYSTDQLRRWYSQYESWRSYVMRILSTRLVGLFSLVDTVAFHPMNERLMRRLNERAARDGAIVRCTHQELADEIGTAREVVSRLLKELERAGHVRLARGRIEVIPR